MVLLYFKLMREACLVFGCMSEALFLRDASSKVARLLSALPARLHRAGMLVANLIRLAGPSNSSTPSDTSEARRTGRLAIAV